MKFFTNYRNPFIVAAALTFSIIYLARGFLASKINVGKESQSYSKPARQESQPAAKNWKIEKGPTPEQQLLSFIDKLRESVGWDFVKMKNYGQDRFVYQSSSFLSLGHSTVTCLPVANVGRVTNVLLENDFAKEEETGEDNFRSETFRKGRFVCKVIVGPCHDQEIYVPSNEEKQNLYFSCILLPEESAEDVKKKTKITNIQDLFKKISKVVKLSFSPLTEDGFVWGATKHNPTLEDIEMLPGIKLKGPGLKVDCVENNTLAKLKNLFNDEGFGEGESYWVASGWASKEYFNKAIGCVIDYDMCTRPRQGEEYEDLANFSIRCGYLNPQS